MLDMPADAAHRQHTQHPPAHLQVQPPHKCSSNGSSGSSSSSKPNIITGRVLLAKHPVAHIGDVRVVTAVDPRTRPGGWSLTQDYVNLVVFSQRGHRPLPNKLSGSDLVSPLFVWCVVCV